MQDERYREQAERWARAAGGMAREAGHAAREAAGSSGAGGEPEWMARERALPRNPALARVDGMLRRVPAWGRAVALMTLSGGLWITVAASLQPGSASLMTRTLLTVGPLLLAGIVAWLIFAGVGEDLLRRVIPGPVMRTLVARFGWLGAIQRARRTALYLALGPIFVLAVGLFLPFLMLPVVFFALAWGGATAAVYVGRRLEAREQEGGR